MKSKSRADKGGIDASRRANEPALQDRIRNLPTALFPT